MSARGWLLAAPVVLLVLAAGVAFGAVRLDGAAVLAGLRDAAAPSAPIVRDIRLPRVLLAFAVGGALGVAGASLQALVRNPLADPYLLGLSGGAGLGAVLAIATGAGGRWGVPVAAFLGALAAVALVYRLSAVAGRRLDARVLILSGVIVGSFASAVMSAVMTLAEAERLRNAFFWLLGGLGSASWAALGLFTAYAVVPAAILLASARRLDLLALGEETAEYLGADVERAKRTVYLAASLLTAASVAVCGMIGFIGLVVPHAVRRLASPLHQALLPLCFVAGGCILVLADLLARVVARPLELPVGIVTATLGLPVFAVILRRTLR